MVGAIQSVHAIEDSKLEQLSVQQVLDCSLKNSGCNGGSPLWALSWLKQVCLYFYTIIHTLHVRAVTYFWSLTNVVER